MTLPNRLIAAGQRFPQVRKWPRYPLIARSELVVPPLGGRIAGEISVISCGGCYFRAAETEALQTLVRLKIEHDGMIFRSWARVANASPGDGMGLAFFETEESQMGVLQKWIDEISAVALKDRRLAPRVIL